MTEGIHYDVEHIEQLVSNIETENDKNRTISLIDSFLSQSHDRGEGDKEIHREQPSITDLTTDYASFLMQKDTEDTNITDTPKLKGSDLIDSFIQETQGKQRIDMPDLQDNEESEFISPDITSEDEEILTETMVNIYIKQGRYEQALKILRKICLNNPKKNAYFANQIDLLEVITEQK
jgi:pentatricopeptide repeat protein